jgi:hypothetical protein
MGYSPTLGDEVTAAIAATQQISPTLVSGATISQEGPDDGSIRVPRKLLAADETNHGYHRFGCSEFQFIERR